MNQPINAARLIDRLEAFTAVPRTLLAHVTPEEARFKPPSGAWSILEIVCHLVDEEVEDFRTRLRLTLENPGTQWPAIDPEGVAKSRAYNARELSPMLESFERERRASVAWLRSLTAPAPWDNVHQHPKWGPIAAGTLLISWAAHDQLHLRQLAKRLFELSGRDGAEFKTDYAGQWGA